MNSAEFMISDIEKSLLGKSEAVRLAVACFFAQGHLLIDDIPGVGKTTLGLAMARSIGCSFQRIQFTSDLLPSDVLGVSVFDQKKTSFEFKSGPIFHHVVLADEINRASPKTQSALLEAMQEGQVSIDNQTHNLPQPFFVIATQNPHEHHGTFPLPESQLDRFMMRINLGYPSPEVESRILKGDSEKVNFPQEENIDSTPLINALEAVRTLRVDESLDRYIIGLAQETRNSPLIDLGLSPRGTLALRRSAQAMAYTYGRDYVIPDDIKTVAPSVMGHRLKLMSGHFNGNSGQTREAMVLEILQKVPIPT